MSGVTGAIFAERYKVGKRENSFYKEETFTVTRSVGVSEKLADNEKVYYVDKNTGELKTHMTTLMGG